MKLPNYPLVLKVAARAALNRGVFVDAALAIIDELGVDKLSMRSVASRLDVSAMAMYKHFPAKEDLLAAALEEFIARANVVPDQDLPWQSWVEQIARRMYHALCRELSWVPLLGSLRLGTQAASVTDAFVEKLCGAGFSAEQAIRAYFATLHIVIGAVCLRASLDARTAPDNAGTERVSPSARASHKRSGSEGLRSVPVLEEVLKDDQIEIALPLLISALSAQLD